MTRARRYTRYALGMLFVAAGVLHFAAPGFYLEIMPPYLPGPRALVYASGVAEIAGGVGVLCPPPVRRWVGVGLILPSRLLAVFPANVHMTHQTVASQGWAAPWTLGTLARLPLQFVLIGIVWWATWRPPASHVTASVEGQ